MINIQTQNIRVPKSIKLAVENSVNNTLLATGLSCSESVSVILTTDEVIQTLNLKYRSIDKPTDVLSFPLNEELPDENEKYLGDIVISYPTAKTQATDAGHPTEHEISLLAIHGVLHLLGYDHDTRENKNSMWQKQKHILDSLGIKMMQYSGDHDE